MVSPNERSAVVIQAQRTRAGHAADADLCVGKALTRGGDRLMVRSHSGRRLHPRCESYVAMGVEPTRAPWSVAYSASTSFPLQQKGDMATKNSKSAPSKSSEKSQDAIALLTADHKAVKALFRKFDELVELE